MSESPCLYKKKCIVKSFDLDDNFSDITMTTTLSNNEIFGEKSYDYITSIPLFNLTEEKIEELNNKLKEKEKELEYVKVTTPIQMWKIELKELLKEYNTWFDIKEKEFNNNITGEINISKLNKKTDIKKKNKVKKL